MILYAVEYYGELTDWTYSIVTIHTTLEGAEEAKNQYIDNCKKNNIKDTYYYIEKIDTDKPILKDCIYQYDYILTDKEFY